jgi:hypothetical protein
MASGNRPAVLGVQHRDLIQRLRSFAGVDEARVGQTSNTRAELPRPKGEGWGEGERILPAQAPGHHRQKRPKRPRLNRPIQRR